MPNITTIAQPRVPLVDPDTGVITREWYRFFLNLYKLTGSGTSDTTIVDISLDPNPSTEIASLSEQFNELQNSSNLHSASEVASLSEQFNELRNSSNLYPRDELGTLSYQNADNVKITGGTIIASGSALSKTDDTNVTLTLGGNYSTALLAPASITVGWSGSLSTDRGGTALTSFTANSVMYASSSSVLATGNSLQFNGTSFSVAMPLDTSVLFISRYEAGGTINTSFMTTTYGGPPSLVQRSAGGTIASPSATTSSPMRMIGSTTNDGTNFFNTTAISAEIDSTPSSGSHPTNIQFATTSSGSTSRSVRMTITSGGNVHTISGTTDMTNGFFYIPSAAGAPTGTPTAISGRVPMYYDSTNNNFYVYNGAWKKVTLT